jgi:hypothetical protein
MRHLAWPVFVVAGLLGWATSAYAQQEQWLQYRTSSNIYQAIGGTWGQKLAIRDDAPDGLALPKFTSDKPIFLRWQPRIDQAVVDKAGGSVWLALDRSRKNGPYDRLYIDSNLNGSLADETPIKASNASLDNGRQYDTFNLVKVTLPGIDGPSAYHLEISYQEYTNPSAPGSTQPAKVQRSARATAAGWYEGEITVDGKKHWCMLIDYNANGCFNDSGEKRDKCDIIRIATKGDRKFVEDSENDFSTRTVGQQIEIDGKFYSLTVADDGASVAFAPATNLPMGNIRVPANISYFSVFGPAGYFLCRPQAGLATVPAGEYSLDRYEVAATDPAGVKWQIREIGASMEKPFSLAEGTQYALQIGEPFKASLSANRTGPGEYSINHGLRTAKGDNVVLRRDGKQPGAPKVHIKNGDGSYDKTFSMEFG